MKNMTLKQIAKAVNGKLFCDNSIDNNAKGVVMDNRLVQEGYVFVAICGNRVDGHTFVNDTIEKGALGAIVEKEGDYIGPYILVDSTEDALRTLATYYREQLQIPIIGVIGSVGKTSTKEMIASVLSEKYKVLKTKGNFNNSIGLPLTILSITEEHQAAVVEMGVSEFGEMEILGEIAKPDIVVFTNIGQCHLENFKTRDGILKEKTRVLDYLNNNATVVVNNDDDKLSTIDEKRIPRDAKIVTYSCKDDNKSMYQAYDIRNMGLEGMKAKVKGEVSAEITIPLPGIHNVSNAMCAIAVANALGESVENIIEGIKTVSTIAGRSNFIKVNGVTIIDDCYNANPASVRAGLGILGMSTGRKIAILGDMGELGDDELNLHRELSESVLDNKIDMLFTVGELSKSIVDDLNGKQIEAKSFVGDDGKERLLDYVIPKIEKGDTILVKASHFMNFPFIVDKIKEALE